MRQPIIGITTTRRESGEHSKISCQENYVRSILRAGGIPLLIPLGLGKQQREDLLNHLDGILLTGGGDIHPKYFKCKSDTTVYGIIPDRDELEVHLVELSRQYQVPLLGICRGCQVMNVALGGTLYTDIPTQYTGALNHSTTDDHPWPTIAHNVVIQRESKLYGMIGRDEIQVNSRHHQGVDKLADNLIASAASPDGLIEAIEASDHPFCLGVQWHPEGMPDDEHAKAIFSAFVAAAQESLENG